MDEPVIEALDHIGAPVWDADAAKTFYEAAGRSVVFDAVLDAYPIRAVFVDVGGGYLELLEPTGPGNVKTFLERHGPGYQHVAYGVSDLPAVMDTLRADGVTFQSAEPQPGAGDCRIVFVEQRHTGGCQVELVERFSPI